MDEPDEIKQHIESWVVKTVDVPNSKTGGLKTCPFARQALTTNSVGFRWYDGPDIRGILLEFTKTWSDNLELLFLASRPENIDPNELHNICEEVDVVLSQHDLFAMADHPYYNVPDDEKEMTNGKYALVFIQKFTKLQAASKYLRSTYYYDTWSKERLEYIVDWRTRYLKYLPPELRAAKKLDR